MVVRPYWIHKIESAWAKRSIVWLSGVRRVGKTTLGKMLADAIYLNCDLPSVVHRLDDPDLFYAGLPPKSIVVFDEIHRLNDPSLVLKIAADEYPQIKILATGSSTLAATKKFRDSLTGRKTNIYLPPVLWPECLENFDRKDLDQRLLHGGLPEALLAPAVDPTFYAEWFDSFFARDIQELFGVRNRSGFIKLLHLLLRQSGGLVDYSSLAKLSQLSRPTVLAHVEAMRIAHAIYLLPPFYGGGKREIVRRPKCYAFDTGFVAFANGWSDLRQDEVGRLWEHLVLDALRCTVPESDIFYWRDKSGREIDFVVRGSRNKVHTLECKINPYQFNAKSLSAFRAIYPHGTDFIISPGIRKSHSYRADGFVLQILSLQDIITHLAKREDW